MVLIQIEPRRSAALRQAQPNAVVGKDAASHDQRDHQSHPITAHYRVRIDIIDQFGKLTLRRAGKLHHLGVGREHARKPVLILSDDTQATVTQQNTGEILGIYDINPTHNYWANKTRKPGQRPAFL